MVSGESAGVHRENGRAIVMPYTRPDYSTMRVNFTPVPVTVCDV